MVGAAWLPSLPHLYPVAVFGTPPGDMVLTMALAIWTAEAWGKEAGLEGQSGKLPFITCATEHLCLLPVLPACPQFLPPSP